MKHIFLAVLFTLVSCASMKEEVKGYNGSERAKALKLITGKTPEEAIAVLGEPAAKGYCADTCGLPNGKHQLVYLNKSLPRYSYALTMANKSELGCFIIDFRYDEKAEKHVYDGFGVMDQVNCSQDYGAIASIRKMKD